MKKILIAIIISLLMINMSACGEKEININQVIRNDQEILQLVERIEKVDAQYYNFDINYQDYSKKLNELNNYISEVNNFSQAEMINFHFNRCPILNLTLRSESQMVMSFDEFQMDLNQEIKRDIEEGSTLPWIIKKTEISKVYSDDQTNFKHVITKMYWDNKSAISGLQDMWSLRKYTFLKENEEWKLLSVETEEKFLIGDKVRKTKLDKINGEEVKFTKVIEY